MNLHNLRPPLVAYYVGGLVLIYFGSLQLLPSDESQAAVLTLVGSSEVFGKEVLSLIKDLIGIVYKLDLAVLGAASVLVIKGREWSVAWDGVDTAIIIAIYVCGALSFYAIYVAYTDLLHYAAANSVKPLSNRLIWAMDVMYYSLVAAFILLGAVFVRMLDGD